MSRFGNMKSTVQQRGPVSFPAFTGERIYMREFYRHSGLSDDLRRWQSTVDAMLDGVDADGPIYLMIDQDHVKAGSTHRRGGLHVDGYWQPSIQMHGVVPRPSHIHSPPKPKEPIGPRHWHTPRDIPTGPRHGHARGAMESIILASDVIGCRAFDGEWNGDIGADGDCAHIDTSGLLAVDMMAGTAYAGDVFMLHESLPIQRDCMRTVVRLNIPGWQP